MSAIEKVRRSRNTDELAESIEPLAQSMATLADEAREQIDALTEASKQSTHRWSEQQTRTAQAWKDAAGEMQRAASALQTQAHAARQAAKGWTWRLWVAVLIGSMTPILVLLIASWLLLDLQLVTTEDGALWLHLLRP